MKKKILKVIALTAAITACFTFALFTGCDDSSSTSSTGSGSTGHVVNPDGIGGEGILDDGGDINFTEPTIIAAGVNYEGEHQIVIGQDTSDYELFNGAVDTATWGSGFTEGEVYRIRCSTDANGDEVGAIFTLDISSLADVSKVGCMVTLINNRTYTLISVSTDKTNWTDIGYGEGAGIKGDYTEWCSSLLGKANTDNNLYQCYYELGDYAVQGQPLYIKCGATTVDSGLASPTGTDVIGLVSYFESLEVIYAEM